VLRAVQEREISSPSKLTPTVDPALAEVVMTVLQRDPARRFQNAGELERRLLTYVIGATRTPEDTDVGLFIRTLFPEEAAREEESDPVPLQLVTGLGPTVSGPHATAASAGLRGTHAEGRLLQKTAPSGSMAPILDEEALAPTRTPSRRRSSQATAPGARQSVVTEAPGEELRALAAQMGARRRRMVLALVGLSVLLGVGAVAFLAGRTEPRPDAPAPHVAAPAPPALPAPAATPPAPEVRVPAAPQPPRAEPATPPAAPGFVMMTVKPWGKLFVDGKFAGDVEGSRRFTLAPGTHTLRLALGKKAQTWTVEIESGKTVHKEHSFLED
jgi:serine/threonine-protein kinase